MWDINGKMKRPFLVALVLFGLCFAFKLYQARWIFQHKPFYFTKDGTPVLTEADGYYFLRLGELIAEGQYRPGAPDPLRNAPDNQRPLESKKVPLPFLPPLLSFLLAVTKWFTGKDIERAFLAFPLIPFLSSLQVFPMFYLGRRLGGNLLGVGLALGASFSLEYLIRTDILRLDTDALNLFFLFSVALLLLRLLDRWSFKDLIGLSIMVHLFQLWYAHPGLLIPLFAFFALSLLLKEKDLGVTLKRTALVLFFSNPFILYQGLFNLLDLFKGYIPGLIKEENPFIPRAVFAQSVSELQKLSPERVFRMTAVHPFLGYLSLLGLFVLYLRERRALLLFPLMLLGMMSLFGARRFMVYLGPFVGLGLGVLVQVVFEITRKRYEKAPLFPLELGLGVLLFLSVIHPSRFAVRPLPPITPGLMEGIKLLKEIAPEGCFVWSWWDYGYPIAQGSKRAVYHDGGSWGGPKSLLVARSFVLPPFKAYNVVNGTTALGEEGIKELLKGGKSPGEILREVEEGRHNRPLKEKVYLLFSGLDVRKFYWISFFGTWDPDRRQGLHLFYLPLGLCQETPQGFMCQRGSVDLKKGLAKEMESGVLSIGRVEKVRLSTDDRFLSKEILREGEGVFFFLVEKEGRLFGFLAHPMVQKTTFHKLFFEAEEGLFKLVLSDFPRFRIYEVLGENLP